MDLPSDKTDSLLRAFLNNSPAIGWLKDADGRHVFLSKPYLEIIGVPHADWLGKTDFDFWPTNVAEKFRADDQEVLETGKLMSFEDSENATFPGGQERIWWVVKFPFWDSQGQGFVGGMAVNITDRKQAEHERQLLEREISEIAEKEQRRIAQDLHDGIGQELTAHSLFAVSLAEKIDVAAAAGSIDPNALKDIQALANKLSAGIHKSNKHLQSISRGMFPLRVDADQLMAMLNELASITQGLPGICCTICGEVPEEYVNENIATHLFRIVQEAINNAVKHGNCNQINIVMSNRDDEFLLTVVDNGCGISRQAADPSVHQGMGLRIMKYRAKLIGASMTLETPIDGGTMVRCNLRRP